MSASSSNPGFSYLVGVADSVISILRNLCALLSPGAGGIGYMGKCRNDEYAGGVEAWFWSFPVDATGVVPLL